MSDEPITTHIRKLMDDVWNRGDFSHIDELYPVGVRMQRSTASQAAIENLRSALPDLRLDIEELVSDATTISMRWRISGTHLGPIEGLPSQDALLGPHGGEDRSVQLMHASPTRRKAAFEGVTIFRTSNDRLIARWDLVDELDLLRQFSVLPVPGLAAGRA